MKARRQEVIVHRLWSRNRTAAGHTTMAVSSGVRGLSGGCGPWNSLCWQCKTCVDCAAMTIQFCSTRRCMWANATLIVRTHAQHGSVEPNLEAKWEISL